MTKRKVVERESVEDIIKPGVSLEIYYNEGNRNNKLIHVRAIVDDHQVVVRRWSMKKGWVYSVEDFVYFETLANGRFLFK